MTLNTQTSRTDTEVSTQTGTSDSSTTSLSSSTAVVVSSPSSSSSDQTHDHHDVSPDQAHSSSNYQSPIVLEARNLNKTYTHGDTVTSILRNINLQICRGEFVGLVGRSGSGKTTLLTTLGLLDTPNSGEVLINGQNVSRLSRKQLASVRRRMIGYVFQSFNLLAGLTAVENVMLPGLLAGKSGSKQHAHAMALLQQVGLDNKAKRVPAELSGGEQQRVAVARALFMTPELILADEPTGNLDTENGQRVINTFYELNKAGQTIVLVTHDRKIADNLPRLVTLKDGEIDSDTGVHYPNPMNGLV